MSEFAEGARWIAATLGGAALFSLLFRTMARPYRGQSLRELLSQPRAATWVWLGWPFRGLAIATAFAATVAVLATAVALVT